MKLQSILLLVMSFVLGLLVTGTTIAQETPQDLERQIQDLQREIDRLKALNAERLTEVEVLPPALPSGETHSVQSPDFSSAESVAADSAPSLDAAPGYPPGTIVGSPGPALDSLSTPLIAPPVVDSPLPNLGVVVPPLTGPDYGRDVLVAPFVDIRPTPDGLRPQVRGYAAIIADYYREDCPYRRSALYGGDPPTIRIYRTPYAKTHGFYGSGYRPPYSAYDEFGRYQDH